MKVYVLYRSAGYDGETQNVGVYTSEALLEAAESAPYWTDIDEFELNAPPEPIPPGEV